MLGNRARPARAAPNFNAATPVGALSFRERENLNLPAEVSSLIRGKTERNPGKCIAAFLIICRRQTPLTGGDRVESSARVTTQGPGSLAVTHPGNSRCRGGGEEGGLATPSVTSF